MFRMIRKNLKNQYTKQTLLALLMLVNIAVTALVICFAYGIYYDFAIKADSGSTEFWSKEFEIAAPTEGLTWIDGLEQSDQGDGNTVSYYTNDKVTAPQTVDFIRTMPDELRHNLIWFDGTVAAMSSLHYRDSSNILYEYDKGIGTPVEYVPDDPSDNDEPYYGVFPFRYNFKDDKIIPYEITASDDIPVFTDDECNSGTDFIYVNQKLTDPKSFYEYQYAGSADAIRVIPKDTQTAVIGGKEYNINYYRRSGTGGSGDILIPLTSFSDSAFLVGKYSRGEFDDDSKITKNNAASFLTIKFNKPLTRDQFNLLTKHIHEKFGKDFYIPNVTLLEEHEMQMLRTVALIAVLIALLAAIDVAILYRYMLEKRSGQLAIMRICGCSKGKAMAAYIIENIIINAPLFALSQLAFHKLILPHLKGLYPTMGERYTLKGYALIFIWYIVISLIVMLALVIYTVHRHSLIQLKNSSRSVRKFGMMKVFEIIQLSVVLGIIVLAVSSALARYDSYKPMEKLLQGNGYVLTLNGIDNKSIKDDFKDIKLGCITAGENYIHDDDGESAAMESIAISGSYVTDYSPIMEDGVWLSQCTDMYKETGVIPVVLGWCNGLYNVGDVIETTYIQGYDENDDPTGTMNVKYKVVGIMQNNQYILGHTSGEYIGGDMDYRYMASLYDYRKDETIFSVSLADDSTALFGAENTYYVSSQLADYSDKTYEEYLDEASKLKSKRKYSYYTIEEIRGNSLRYVFSYILTLMPVAVCIFLLMIISAISVNAIYTKRQLRNYAIFYICGARWRSCALKSLKNELVTCGIASALTAAVLIIGKYTFLKKMLVSFGLPQLGLCAAVIVLYLALSVIMPLCIIGTSQPKDVLKEE